MDPLTLKIVLVVVMMLLTVAFGIAPLQVLKILRKRNTEARVTSKARRYNWPSLLLCLLSCFTGGVFLSTCFLHLLPEAILHMENIKETYHWDTHYPWAELVSCIGFFLVFFVEELVLYLMSFFHHDHSISKGPSAPHVHTLTRHTESCENISSPVGSPSKVSFLCQSSSMKRKGERNGGVRQECVGEKSDEGPVDEHKATVEVDFVNGIGKEGRSRHLHDAHDETCTLTKNDLPNGADTAGHITEMCHLDIAHLPSDGMKACASSCKQVFEVVPTTTFGTAEPECCEGPCEGFDEDPPIQIAFRPHAHHHGVRSVTLIIALSFHSVIEGIAFGIQAQVESVAALFLSIIFHKCIVAFSVGLQLARTHAHQLRMVVISILILALMSPVGTAVGIAVDQSDSRAKEIAIMVFEGLSVGTFLYVTFFEVFLHERDNEHPSLLKLLGSILGFVLIALIRTMEHKHETDISHEHHDHAITAAVTTHAPHSH